MLQKERKYRRLRTLLFSLPTTTTTQPSPQPNQSTQSTKLQKREKVQALAYLIILPSPQQDRSINQSPLQSLCLHFRSLMEVIFHIFKHKMSKRLNKKENKQTTLNARFTSFQMIYLSPPSLNPFFSFLSFFWASICFHKHTRFKGERKDDYVHFSHVLGLLGLLFVVLFFDERTTKNRPRKDKK